VTVVEAVAEPVAELREVPAPVAAEVEEAVPTPNPDVIYPETGAVDTYEAQLALARRLKRGSRAVAAYRRAIALNPQGSPALAELARLMLARSHAREAAELAERATAIEPSNALAWVALGAARQMRGDQQGARQAYQNCAKLGKGRYVSECRAMLR
jgi:tetratricopeptide (TPR) repeat protein